MSQPLQEALTPAERYEREIRRMLAQIDRLEAASLRRALALLTDARRQILDRLASIDDATYLASFQRRLLSEIEATLSDYRRRYQTLLRTTSQDVWSLGHALVDAPLQAAGVTLMVRLPSVDPRLIDVLADFQATLVSGLEDTARQALTREIQLGALGKPLEEVSRAIAEVLRTRANAAGRRGSLAAQVERVQRTELNRVLNLATHGRQRILSQRLAAVTPEVTVRKRWVNAGDTRVRPAHRRKSLLEQRPALAGTFEYLATNGQVYHVVGPYDPQLPAADSIGCRCRSVVAVDSIEALLTEAA